MTKPAPKITPINAPFWQGCNEDRLMLQRCEAESCRRYVFYPRVCCPHCGHGELSWREASGRGRVRTYTVVHHPLNEGFREETPFVFAAVTLEEGPMMYTRIDVDPDMAGDLLERPVTAIFRDDQVPGQKLPFFRPEPG